MSNVKIKADMGLGDYEAIDMTLPEFKAKLDALAVGIGADNDTANVFIEYEGACYDESASITAYVWRWETEAEETDREAAEKVARAKAEQLAIDRREQHDRATYEALKAKFEAKA